MSEYDSSTVYLLYNTTLSYANASTDLTFPGHSTSLLQFLQEEEKLYFYKINFMYSLVANTVTNR